MIVHKRVVNKTASEFLAQHKTTTTLCTRNNSYQTERPETGNRRLQRAEEVKRFVKGLNMKAFITRIMLLLYLMTRVYRFALRYTRVACQLVDCETTLNFSAGLQRHRK